MTLPGDSVMGPFYAPERWLVVFDRACRLLKRGDDEVGDRGIETDEFGLR